MPHFVIECNHSAIPEKEIDAVMQAVHEIAVSSELFDLANIKVRLNKYEHSIVAGERGDFIHVFANIMQGRTEEQRAALSKEVVQKLKDKFPDVLVISVNVWEFEKATYSNLRTIQD